MIVAYLLAGRVYRSPRTIAATAEAAAQAMRDHGYSAWTEQVPA